MTEIPPGWASTTLDQIALWGSGGTPSRRNPEFFSGDIPWIKTGELGAKYVRSAEEHISQKATEASSAKKFPKGSVGIAMYGATIGKVSIWGIDAATNQACAVAQCLPGIFNEYLYCFLLSQRNAFTEAGKGGAQPNISQTVLKDWPLTLPPTNEQRRIVAKIEELFSELDKGFEALTTAREQLNAYRQSVLKHALEGRLTKERRKANPQTPENLLANVQAERKTRNPKKASRLRPEQHDASLDPQVPDGWSIEFLGNLNVEIFDGPFGSHLKTSDYVESGVRVIRLENIGQGHFIDKKQSFVSKEKYKGIQRHTVVPGDIVFSSFVTEAIRSALVPSHISFAVNKADCFAIRFFGKTINPKFVQLFLRSRNPFKQVEGMIHGVGRPRINTSQLKEIVVPICAPAEQDLIIERLEAIFSETDALESTLETGLAQLAAMRQSILKQAFSGQLVAQDPKDESASVLLERIRAEREGTSTNKSRNSKNGKSRKKNAA
jgi:type I restriction enzyme S subunit